MNNFKRIVTFVVLFATPMVIAQDAVFEELTVTAQKRTSTVMDTAAAIAAITGDDLQERGIRNVADLDQLSPDLVIGGEGHSRKGIRIRGIGTYGFDIGADPSVAVVIDGVNQPRTTTNMQNFTDLERIEVLKGPQGAIYGVNALGGIINIVTKKPGGGTSGKVSLIGGDNGNQGLNLSLDTDITNSISGRFTFTTSQEDGTSFETNSGLDNGVAYDSFRASLFGSTDSGWDWNGVVSHGKVNQDALIFEQDFICNSASPASGFLPVFHSPAPTHPGNVCETKPDSTTNNVRGKIRADNVTVIKSLASQDSQPLSTPGYNFSEGMTASLNAQKDFDNFSVTTILGLTKVNSGELRDFDATDIDALTQGHSSKTGSTSFEVRFDSDDSIKYPWSVGLYGLRDHGYRTDEYVSGPGSLQNVVFSFAASAAAVGLAPAPANYPDILSAMEACVVSGTCEMYVRPGLKRTAQQGGAFVVAQDVQNLKDAINGTFSNTARMGIKTSSSAIFGNVKFSLADNLELFVGGRYSIHDKPYTYEGTTSNNLVPLVPMAYKTGGGLTAREFDPKVTLEYTQDEALTWLTYSTAYKSGGPAFAKWNKADAEKTYAQEEVEMIEAGYKTDLNGGASQFEATVYSYDYTDNQQLLVCINAAGSPAGCVVTGDATIQGLDLTYRSYLSDKTSIGGTYAFVDATWDRFCDTAAQPATQANPCGIDRKGQTMPFSAENNLSAYIQHVENMDMGELSLTASVSYKDEYSTTLAKWSGVSTVDDLTKINLSAELQTLAGWKVNATCTNCTDEDYLGNGLFGVRAQGGGFRYTNAEGRRIVVSLSTEF